MFPTKNDNNNNSQFLWLCVSRVDVDELAVHRLQYGVVLHRGSVLQRLLSHLLLALQPVLDHAEAAAGPALLPALCRHAGSGAAAQVTTPAQIFLSRAAASIRTRCVPCLSSSVPAFLS